MNAVDIRNIRFAYPGEHTLFEDFSLSIIEGRVTALLGPNGSGKSTLLALVLGFLNTETGNIQIFSRDSSGYSRKERGNMTGFVSQSGKLPFNYSAAEYILLGRGAGLSIWEQPSPLDKRKIVAAAERAGAEALLEKNVQELSAGELQLVQISRALAQEPRLLLLDEPTSHLDPANALSILKLLRQLASDGVTVLYSTHDPLHARQAADEAVLIKKGSVLTAGSVADALSADNLEKLYGIKFREAVFESETFPFAGM